MQWLSSSVNDVLLSLTPSDEAIAKASEIAIVDMVDWFDVKLSNLFSASPSVDSRKSSTFPFLGVKMMTSVSESIFSPKNNINKSKSTSSNDGVVEKKNVAVSLIQNKIENKNKNKEYSVLLAMKFESIAQVLRDRIEIIIISDLDSFTYCCRAISPLLCHPSSTCPLSFSILVFHLFYCPDFFSYQYLSRLHINCCHHKCYQCCC